MISLYRTIDDIPKALDGDKIPEFWKVAESDHIKSLCLFQIRTEIRDDVGNLTDAQCRSVLSKIQAYLNTMNFMDRVDKTIEERDANESLDDQDY